MLTGTSFFAILFVILWMIGLAFYCADTLSAYHLGIIDGRKAATHFVTSLVVILAAVGFVADYIRG